MLTLDFVRRKIKFYALVALVSFKFGCFYLFSMASLSNKSKADNGSVKTFLKWTFTEFSYEVHSEGDIASVMCKQCSLKWPEIEIEAKLRKYKGHVIQGFKKLCFWLYDSAHI